MTSQPKATTTPGDHGPGEGRELGEIFEELFEDALEDLDWDDDDDDDDGEVAEASERA